MTSRCHVVYIFLDVLGQIVPSTLKRQPRQETARPRPTAPRSEGSRPAEDRAAYRRAPGTGPDKKADVGAGTGDVEFVSSYSY
jgi:small subunit ribosomal protein S10e